MLTALKEVSQKNLNITLGDLTRLWVNFLDMIEYEQIQNITPERGGMTTQDIQETERIFRTMWMDYGGSKEREFS
jgi:hypothetical protein